MLVGLQGADARPDFFVVPRNVVAAYLHISYRSWLTVPSKTGAAHKENTMRNVEEEAVRCYHECWDLLEQPAEDVPYWLPDWVFDWAKKTGLPDGHPGFVYPSDSVRSAEDAALLPYWIPARAAPAAT